jgi:protein O-GlcNAc transferase
LMHQGDLASAVDVLRRLTADEPQNAEAFYNLGVALKQKDDFEGAEEALKRSIALDPNLPDAPYTLGVVVWQTGRAEQAVALFRDAIARRPKSAEPHYMLGTVLRQTGKVDDAIAEFRAAIAANDELPEAHLSLSQALLQKGDVEGARTARVEADRLNKRKADAQASAFAVGAGQQRIKAGDRAGAIAKFREAIQLASDNAEAHYALAAALEQSGARAEARRHLAEARKLGKRPMAAEKTQ